jgi:hypothetical protein
MARGRVLGAVVAAGVSVVLAGGAAAPRPQPEPLDRSTWRWYKGNTHAHTLESDGDSTPEEVARWYKDQGYQFLVLSDHNVLVKIDELSRQLAVPEQFLLVPGEEVTDAFEKKPLHVNGLNVRTLVPAQHGAIRAADGVPHVNHPNFGWAITPGELAALERYRLLEIFNGHPLVNNLGGGDAPGMEDVWDRLLAAGKRVYGIAVDDAHYFKRPWDARAPKPGQGWVVVRAPRLDPAALMASLEAGEFYASTGVELASYEATGASIAVEVRPLGDTRYRVWLIDAAGIVEQVEGPTARFSLAGRRTFARVVVRDSNGASAWGQPVFLD